MEPTANSDKPIEIEEFSEDKIYEGIFNIFELELEEISRYVAFTNKNMSVYSNKIHELHLRVCSEIENVLKIVIHKYFIEEGQINQAWESEKSSFLEKKGATKDYETLYNQLNAKGQVELNKRLFGHPDFGFYFKAACNQFHLNQKVVEFSGMVSRNMEWRFIQPFEIERVGAVPFWWTNYNKLKHDKLQRYDLCTLKDLIYSVSGLFILMNYLLKYQQDNNPREDYEYRIKKIKSPYVTINNNFCVFKSKFFQPQTTPQLHEFSLILPEELLEEEFHTVTIGQLASTARLDLIYLNDMVVNKKLIDIDLASTEYRTEFESKYEKQSRLRFVQHSLFYIYLDYKESITFQDIAFRKLRLLARFVN